MERRDGREHRLEDADSRHGPQLADRLGGPHLPGRLPTEETRADRVLLCLDRKTGKMLWQQDGAEGAAGKEAHAQQLRLRHAGHRRQAGLCLVPRARFRQPEGAHARRHGRRRVRLRRQPEVARQAGPLRQRARLLQLAGAVRGQGDRQRRPRRRRLHRGPGSRDRQGAVADQRAQQHPQLRHADHSRDRRPHADGALRQQVRRQLRPAHRHSSTG